MIINMIYMIINMIYIIITNNSPFFYVNSASNFIICTTYNEIYFYDEN